MTPDRANEAAKGIKRGIRDERCSRCLRVLTKDAHDGLCSPDCAQAALEEISQSKLRQLVFERDKGVCSEPSCRRDCVAAQKLRDFYFAFGGASWQSHRRLLLMFGFDADTIDNGKSFWEAHHKDERVKGGGNVLSNLVTLCCACHAEKTAGLARGRAASRKPRGQMR